MSEILGKYQSEQYYGYANRYIALGVLGVVLGTLVHFEIPQHGEMALSISDGENITSLKLDNESIRTWTSLIAGGFVWTGIFGRLYMNSKARGYEIDERIYF